MYDAVGRKTSLWHGAAGTGTKRAEWTYDTLTSGSLAKGQLTRSTRWHNGRAYTSEITGFDDSYRPLGTTIRLPAEEGILAGPWTTAMTYKVDGSPASTTYPAGAGLAAETVSYGYDDNGYPLTTSGLDTYVSATSYYPWGGLHERTLGTGTKRVQLRTTIDEATGRLAESRAATEHQTNPGQWVPQLIEKYSYDDSGNLKTINEVDAGATVSHQCFTYDPLRQLTEAWTTTATICQAGPSQANVGGPDPYWFSYRYDQIGNRTTETIHKSTGDTTRSYTYPAPGANRPHALVSVTASGATTGTDTYGYDPSGRTITRNRAGRPGQTLAWDPEGHLESVTDTTGTISYIYTPGGDRLLAIEPSGVTLYLDGYELRRTGAGVTSTRHYGVAARTVTGGLFWQSADHHDTGQLSIKADDLTATRRRSDPFGNIRGTQPAWPTTRGFVNGTTDPTGLTHLGAREYDATIGRFISVDPIRDFTNPAQMHGYTYANSNPTTAADPTGLLCLEQCGSAEDKWFQAQVRAQRAVERKEREEAERLRRYECRRFGECGQPINSNPTWDERNGRTYLGGYALAPHDRPRQGALRSTYNDVSMAQSACKERSPCEYRVSDEQVIELKNNAAVLLAVCWIEGCDAGFATAMEVICDCLRNEDSRNILVVPVGPARPGRLSTQKVGPTQRLTGGQAKELARYLGYRPTNERIRGQRVFTNGKDYIVQDIDSHTGGTWKIANSPEALLSKETRTATTDALLNFIGG